MGLSGRDETLADPGSERRQNPGSRLQRGDIAGEPYGGSMSVPPHPLDDQTTRDAAERLVSFLTREIDTLPRGHDWRGNYQRQLLRMYARYPQLSSAED